MTADHAGQTGGNTGVPPVHEVSVPGLRGPAHSWLVVGDHLHTEMHRQHVEHTHRPETP